MLHFFFTPDTLQRISHVHAQHQRSRNPMSDITSDHEDREEMLREQLRQAREELEEEKRANMAADAALRAQEAQESRRHHEEILTQLRDLTGTLREQREMHQECPRVSRKVDDEHGIEKGSEVATLRGMMKEIRGAQKADEGNRKDKAVTARAVTAGRSRRTTIFSPAWKRTDKDRRCRQYAGKGTKEQRRAESSFHIPFGW